MTHNAPCDLCGEYTRVTPSLVEWAVPIGERFANVDRCLDREACRERIVSRGDTWPVIEPAAEGSRKGAEG